MIKVILISIILLTGTGCSQLVWWVANYPSDNSIEETIEEIVKDKTGHDIDLSPFSEEGEKECRCNLCEERRKRIK